MSPIIIGSDGRSGSTLLAMVLDSHPDIAIMVELHYKGPPNLGQHILDYLNSLHDDKLARQFIARVERNGISSLTLRGLILDLIAGGNPLVTFSQRSMLISRLGIYFADSQKKKTWGLKIMKAVADIRPFHEVWPGAKFIHIVRNGLDIAASQLNLNPNSHLRSHSWGYLDIKQAAEGWVRLMAQSKRNAEGLDYYVVRYEDIIDAPGQTILSLCQFLGVGFHDAMLTHDEIPHHFFESTVSHPSREQCQRPINKSAVGRYRRDLTAEQVKRFTDIAGETLKEYGYED